MLKIKSKLALLAGGILMVGLLLTASNPAQGSYNPANDTVRDLICRANNGTWNTEGSVGYCSFGGNSRFGIGGLSDDARGITSLSGAKGLDNGQDYTLTTYNGCVERTPRGRCINPR